MQHHIASPTFEAVSVLEFVPQFKDRNPKALMKMWQCSEKCCKTSKALKAIRFEDFIEQTAS